MLQNNRNYAKRAEFYKLLTNTSWVKEIISFLKIAILNPLSWEKLINAINNKNIVKSCAWASLPLECPLNSSMFMSN